MIDVREAEHTTDNSGVQYCPAVVTDRSPLILVEDLHVTVSFTQSSGQAHNSRRSCMACTYE